MPLIFEAKCSACGHTVPALTKGCLALIVDEPNTSMFAHEEDPHLVVLAHPGESSILEECGFTFDTAEREGRLVGVAEVYCMDCGTRYEIRRIRAGLGLLGCTGCLGLLVLGVVMGAAVGWATSQPWLGFLVGWSLVSLLVWLCETGIDRWVRRRHAERVQRFDRGPGCPKCRSREYARVAGWWRRPPCSQCGQRQIQFRSIGIS